MFMENIFAIDDAEYGIWSALARQCAGEGTATAALEHARRAIGIDPSRPEAFNLLGVCCEFRRRPLEAQKYYRVALVLDPAYEPALRNLHRLVSYNKRGQVALGI